MSEYDETGTKGYRGPSRAAPYPLSRLSGPVSLVDTAREIEQASQLLASTTSAELSLIAEQMRALTEKARQVLARAEESASLHRVRASFKRIPGKIYHLYSRDDGERYWSLLSPEEWAGAPPHRFCGSFRLEVDQSWTPVAEVTERDAARATVEQLIGTRLLPK